MAVTRRAAIGMGLGLAAGLCEPLLSGGGNASARPRSREGSAIPAAPAGYEYRALVMDGVPVVARGRRVVVLVPVA